MDGAVLLERHTLQVARVVVESIDISMMSQPASLARTLKEVADDTMGEEPRAAPRLVDLLILLMGTAKPR